MGVLDWFRKPKYDVRAAVSRGVQRSSRNFVAGKQTATKWEQQFFWYEGTIKRAQYRTKEVMENLKIIRDLNPDSSMAIWNFLRLGNNGHEVECLTADGKPDKEGLAIINDLAKRVGKLYGGGTDQLINVLLLTGYTQGAIGLEVELTEGIDDVVDFHALDPITLDFRKDKETGEMELVQKQIDGNYKVLNTEQVFYFPFDPEINDPYGRSPILPILQIVFFQIEVLKDLKKVVHHQGHARFDISVVEEAIMNAMPHEVKTAGPEAVNKFVQSYIADVQKMMSELKPDDDFFHTDSVKVQMTGGTAGKSMDATRVIDVVNQQIVTALKQLPILLGRNEGTTETHGTVQWQIYVAGIESIQRGVKRLLERAYNVALQVNGRQSHARLTFNDIRVGDRLKEAQAEEVETRTKLVHVQQGWIDNNEAANDMVGHDAVSEPQPPAVPVNSFAARSRRLQVKRMPKSRAEMDEDEYVKELDTNYASDLAKLTTEAAEGFHTLLQRQLEQYLDNIQQAPELPTRMLVGIESLRAMKIEDLHEPTIEFREWVRAHVLTNESEQLELWNDEGLDWIEQAAKLAGEATIVDLDVDVEFNAKDSRLLRWLTNRAKDSAELIQGVTDEDVIMTLWDVAYEGKFTVVKFSEALQEAHTFSKGRATLIARTEVLNAGRAGQYHGDLQSGIVIGKEWMSANQERTRLHHRAANGQVVPFDEPFVVKNEELMFPGDYSLGASANNVIQCRCWYKRILQGEEDKLKG